MKTLNLAAGRLETETLQIPSKTGDGRHRTVAAEMPLCELSSLRLQTILAPFDFSDVSAALLCRLITLAENSNATVHVLHVVEPSAGPVVAGETPNCHRARVAAARRQIKEWVEQAFSTHVSITTTVRVGRAADEIVAQAHALYADLIVMSAHSREGRENGLPRTTTEQVVRQSPCPVLVVGRNQVPDFLNEPDTFPPRAWKRILLRVDLSNDFRNVLAYAGAIVQENGGRLHILHRATSADLGEPPDTDTRLIAWLRSELRWPVEYEAAIWKDMPLLNAILHEVNHSGIDLIVLPARNCARFRRLSLGSITDGILRHAPCPVLSVNQHVTPVSGAIPRAFNND